MSVFDFSATRVPLRTSPSAVELSPVAYESHPCVFRASSLRDNAAVDIHTLIGRTKAREPFHQFDKITSDNTACSLELVGAGRAIIIVSDSSSPEGTDTEPVAAPENRNALFSHFRFSSAFIRVSTADSAEAP